ncbi:hypothetical protein NLX71_23590 [Paenibacillus sp. MZ04-78.2]|nr:hypothetical protein [Paenibacillus sp. MZ04-78.2]
MENYIKEVKNGFSIDHIATSDFKANELDFLIKLLAYNCLNASSAIAARRFIDCQISFGIFPLCRYDHRTQPSRCAQVGKKLCQPVRMETYRGEGGPTGMTIPIV